MKLGMRGTKGRERASKRLRALALVVIVLGLLAGCSPTPLTPDPVDQPPIVTPPGPPEPVDDPPAPPPCEVPSAELDQAFPSLTFSQPLAFVHPGDGSDLVFVVEKPGRILAFDNDPRVAQAETFLDLRDRLDSGGSEKGLLGLAFHPSYADTGLLYVNYTTRTHTVVSSFAADPANPRRALADSEQVILTFAQPFANHNGGCLAFGPDGYLYIGSGDGGSSGDPQGNAQDLTNLLGAILRIDVNRAGVARPYEIPPDNPWAGNSSGYREEIFAYGLRNPWRFGFDEQGRLWVADVGQNAVEEINLVEGGLNYGWNIMEGSQCYPATATCNRDGLELPIWEYNHPLGRSVTGGYVYAGGEIPSLRGHYVYGDYVTGLIWALRIDDLQSPENHLLLRSGLRIASFGVDRHNELYVVDLRGRIYRLRAPQKTP